MNKYSLIALLIVSPFFIAFLFILTHLTTEQVDKLGYAPIVIIIIYLLFIYHHNKRVNKKLRSNMKFLYEEIDLSQYITKMNELINKTYNNLLHKYMSINLAIGYNANGEPGKAIKLLESINLKGFTRIDKVIYYNNLADYYLNENNLSKAMEVFSQGEKYIKKLPDDSYVNAYLMLTKAIIYYL
jgi:tetratricopeptide (TPR) repeat protein